MDTDKAWHGLAFLLAKFSPAVDVLNGGTPLTTHEWGYGCPRLLTDSEVVAAARTFEQITTADLAGVYDPAELARADVYPQIWSDGQALEYLQSVYVDLVGFFRAGASDGDAVVVWLS